MWRPLLVIKLKVIKVNIYVNMNRLPALYRCMSKQDLNLNLGVRIFRILLVFPIKDWNKIFRVKWYYFERRYFQWVQTSWQTWRSPSSSISVALYIVIVVWEIEEKYLTAGQSDRALPPENFVQHVPRSISTYFLFSSSEQLKYHQKRCTPMHPNK